MNSSFKRNLNPNRHYKPRVIKNIPHTNTYSVKNSVKKRRVINKNARKKTSSGFLLKNILKKIFFSKKLWTCFFIFLLILIIFFSILISILSRNIPNPNQLIEREVAQSTTIYDRSGEHILYEFHGDEKRTLINLDDIPDYAKQATIAIEDKNFYKHRGFSVLAMLRTAVTNIIYHRRAGGSTLTQQFVKNALLSSEKKYSRKIKEILIAQKIEKKFSKDEILQMYLNEIPYGSNAYGIEAASQKYFAKSAKDLTIAESAILAALPQAPSKYSPYGPNKDILLGRQQYILDLMEEQGYLNKEEKEGAKKEEIVFRRPETDIVAPHFVMYVREILSEKYGEKILDQGGLKIYTTIDLNKQKIAEEAIRNRAEENNNKYNASNASLVAIDPKNGQILAMVGSRDYFNNEIDGQVNVAVKLRQPGSSLKPLVYATLFQKGYNPNTIFYDVVTNFSSSNPYEPRNYNNQEQGPVSLRKALAGSLNVPAVKAIYLAGINNVIRLAKDAGYTTLNDPDRYGLSLVLGGAEVKLLEHVNAFSIFAREGEISPISSILKVEDNKGKVLEEFEEKKTKVLDANIARMINNVLSDNSARSFIFGERNNLTLSGRAVATKTGTTNNFRDAWTVGYTPSLIAGVWVGNNDNSEMSRGADGSVVAAPIWNEFMRKSLEGSPVEYFKEPEIKKTGKAIIDGELIGKDIKINKEDGSIATENTPEELIEEVFFPEHHSILYYVDINDPLGAPPKNPEKDPQFNLWENRILEWAKKQDPEYNPDIIQEAEDLYNPENAPVFDILNIKNGDIINSENLVVEIEAQASRGIHRIDYFINNNLLDRKTAQPFNLNKNISFLENAYYNLKIIVCDDVLNCSEKSLDFNLLLSNNNKTPSNLNLIYPTSGLALNVIDFPLKVQMVTTNPEQITKIDLILKKKNGSENIIKTISPVLNKTIEIDISEVPESSSYKLYAVFYDWSGKKKETNQITISIN